MDQKELGLTRYDAGAEYLSALRRLRLEPEALFWAYDHSDRQFFLVVVTDLIDHAGPLPLMQLLFDAYNLSATPKEVDPFFIRVHSPHQNIYRELRKFLTIKVSVQGIIEDESNREIIAGRREPFIIPGWKFGTLEGFSAWVYKSTSTSKVTKVDAERRWRRFQRTVHQLAA